ncbi:hypothetical protein KEJ48_07735 [Candidatus Bathyarchaeota archaeon]|nr:hypothetical protein [Candidatus Bathyarchaeota archaeon]MBS7618791.1 hypothetical protein [Candidatus Bathyarchaeota archaeon]
MRKVQVLTPIMFALVLSTLIVSPIVIADNDNDAEGLENRAKVMLRLLEITERRANQTLELLNETTGGIPEDINATYQDALSLYNQSKEAYNNGNYSGSIELGRRAMSKFEYCLKNACRLLMGEVEEFMAWRGLTVALERLREFIDRVKALRDKAWGEFEGLREDIEEYVDPLIEEANATANEAEELIKSGYYVNASKAIGEGHSKAAHALAALNRLLKGRIAAIGRAKRYMWRVFERLSERIRERARHMERVRARVILNKLDQIADKLEKLKGIPSDEEVRERLRERLTEIQDMLEELLEELED